MSKESVIFLTRGEIIIFSEFYLSVHLKKSDSRRKDIERLIKVGKLKILTIDPKLEGFNKFYRGNWYLIQTLDCISFSDSADGYTHFRLRYKYDSKKFLWEEGGGVRLLEEEEISKIRKTLTI